MSNQIALTTSEFMHLIIDAYERGRDGSSNLTSLPGESVPPKAHSDGLGYFPMDVASERNGFTKQYTEPFPIEPYGKTPPPPDFEKQQQDSFRKYTEPYDSGDTIDEFGGLLNMCNTFTATSSDNINLKK